ncbi:ABC transporter permease [Beggiatoa leptomitoformis]|uniref:Transport permease protein n=1 Tax=Beggiatoa leptomitoformis TaxID=288004 RepID=A0A2N9YI77_9GAMM|nr:ABC transporter permease [Beggiatoa leptomitoformis]ALG67524.1 ABC transporter permease [Beggiatoa leptomitoformis]AUI70251.1 ABC transporter permease [Beggiatoa leptomitoformis]
MPQELHKIWAFIVRDWQNEQSYKLVFLPAFFSLFTLLFTFFFLARLFNHAQLPALQPYGGDYFAFVLIGLAFFNYLEVLLKGLPQHIREGQLLGTLEALLVTPTALPTLIIASIVYDLLWATVRVGVYLGLAVWVFHLSLHANLIAVSLLLFLTLITFSSLGIFTASIVILLKKGEAISSLFVSLSRLLCGLYYPISVLPDSLQTLAGLFPVTYALEGLRLALLQGYSLSMLTPILTPLFLFALCLLPTSLFAFHHAIQRAKRDGTLTQY